MRQSGDTGDLVTVFSTMDETAAAVAESILVDAGIQCMVKGGQMRDVTGLSRLAALFRSGVPPVEVQVLDTNAEEAASLLSQLAVESEVSDP